MIRAVVAFRAAAVAVALIALGCRDPTVGARTLQGHKVVEKGPYQSLYGSDGKLMRVLQDRNGDRTADAIVLYSPSGKPRQAEIDADHDGVIDRWEYFEEGTLVRVGTARRQPGTPDYWERMNSGGTAEQREYDDDGNGTIDRVEAMTTAKVR